MPKRPDLFGVLCAFVVVYCLVANRWEPLASLALLLAAFAVALPRMVGAWKVGRDGISGSFPPIDAEFERIKPPPPPGPESALDKGSHED